MGVGNRFEETREDLGSLVLRDGSGGAVERLFEDIIKEGGVSSAMPAKKEREGAWERKRGKGGRRKEDERS